MDDEFDETYTVNEINPIKPGSIYRNFTFSSNIENFGWIIQGELSADLVAGLLAGTSLVNDDIVGANVRMGHKIIYNYHGDNIVIIIPDKLLEPKIVYNLHTVGVEDILKNYIVMDVKYKEIINKNIKFPKLTDEFLWWIPNLADDTIILYKFRTSEFIQGFISICNAFNIDFREYPLGPPFKVNDNGEEMYYNIQGYDIDLEL